MAVMNKNKNPEKYEKTELIDPKVGINDDLLIKELLIEYNKEHHDNIIKLEEP